MDVRKLLLYLDTNLFLDLIRKRRNKYSVALFQDIEKGRYDAVTSTFSLLEMIQEEQERAFMQREFRKGRNIDEIRGNLKERDLLPSSLGIVYTAISEN